MALRLPAEGDDTFQVKVARMSRANSLARALGTRGVTQVQSRDTPEGSHGTPQEVGAPSNGPAPRRILKPGGDLSTRDLRGMYAGRSASQSHRDCRTPATRASPGSISQCRSL